MSEPITTDQSQSQNQTPGADHGCCSTPTGAGPTVSRPAAVALPLVPLSGPAGDAPAQPSCESHGAGPCCGGPAAPQSAGVSEAAVPELDEVQMIDALKQVIDPELMINIVDLGLIYSITQDERQVHVEMTLTSPACPAGPQIVHQSKMSLEQLPGIEKANIRLVMSPPWTPARMTDEARDILGIF